MEKLLIANRGEIALRIARTARESGITTVGIYADQDLNSPAVRAVDEAYALEGSTVADTYNNGEKILAIAARAKVDAIHPGYGFLAEDTDFATAVINDGLTWIGPSPAALAALGNKISARTTAETAGVAPVPGLSTGLKNIAQLRDFIAQNSLPVAVKRADGGGGRGIHMLRTDTDVENFSAQYAADPEALTEYFVERLIEGARHVETQCGRDAAGNFTVYSTRECSVQRRNQKLLEEAPAPALTAKVTEKLYTASNKLFTAVDYVGLGTCEYLVEPGGEIWFLEVNPRLQVEHTVSEEVAGIDLVSEQLRIAQRRNIITNGTQDCAHGHAIQIRLTSEDPANNLMPSFGTITKLNWPGGPGVRIDSGVEIGSEITPDFDSLIAKLIVWAPTRAAAIARARRALAETVIQGVATPAALYREILTRPEYAAAAGADYAIHTKWLENTILSETETIEKLAEQSSRTVAESNMSGYSQDQRRSTHTIEIDGRRHELSIPGTLLGDITTSHGRRAYPYQPLRKTNTKSRSGSDNAESGHTHLDENGTIVSPIQAIIVRYTVAVGEQVAESQLLVVLESMKMESYIYAPCAGTVTATLSAAGASVNPGTELLRLETA